MTGTRPGTAGVLAAFAGLLLVVAAAHGVRAHEACPAKDNSAAAISTAIAAEKDCPTAYEVMNACRFNSGADVGFSAIVVEKCEAGFRKRLTPSQARRYERAVKACEQKALEEPGTLGVSFQVTCEARVAVRYNRRFARPARPD